MSFPTYTQFLDRALRLRGTGKGPFKHVDECAMVVINGVNFRIGFNEHDQPMHYVAGSLRNKTVFMDRYLEAVQDELKRIAAHGKR